MTQRNPVFDIMKGIAIMAVVLGHTAIPEPLHQFIYSFHMPLFFLLSGYFFNEKSTLRKDAKRLLVPYALTILAILAFTALRSYMKGDITVFTGTAVEVLYGTPDALYFNHPLFPSVVHTGAPPIWFLLALFWGRMVYRWLPSQKWVNLLCSTAITAAVLLYNKFVGYNLPFLILQGLSSVVFLGIGRYVRQYGIPRWGWAICIVLWVVSMVFFELEIAQVNYSCPPVTILGSVGGVYVIYLISGLVSRFTKVLSVALQWCGKNSMTILCCHSFDIFCCWVSMALNGALRLNLPRGVIMALRTTIMMISSWLLSLVPLARKVFGGGTVQFNKM